jgi:hypothetical protein
LIEPPAADVLAGGFFFSRHCQSWSATFTQPPLNSESGQTVAAQRLSALCQKRTL